MTGYYFPVFMPTPSDGDSNFMSLPATKHPIPSAEDLYFMTLLETGCPVLSAEDLHFITPLVTEYPCNAEDLTVNHNYIGEGIQTQIDWMDIDSSSVGIETSIDWMDVDSTGAENCIGKEVSWIFSRISYQMFWEMVEKIGSDYLREIEEREWLGNGAKKKKKNKNGRDHVHFGGLDSCSKSCCGYQQPLPQSIGHGQSWSHHQSTGDHQPDGHNHQRPSRGRNGRRNNGISPNPPDRGNKPWSPGNRPHFGGNNHRLTGRNNHHSHHLPGENNHLHFGGNNRRGQPRRGR